MAILITIDAKLMDLQPEVEGMKTLKLWQEQGLVQLIEANKPKAPVKQEYGWPGAPPKEEEPGKRRRRGVKKLESGKANFKSMALVLYDFKNPDKLKMDEINDVAHLILHHQNHRDYFVTTNKTTILAKGKPEKLKKQFGIIAMTPLEMVSLLSGSEGWKPAPEDSKAS